MTAIETARDAFKAEVVTFHQRAIRYGSPICGRECGTIEEALAEACYDFDYGESAEQEIWCGDECIMDHEAFMAWMDQREQDG